MEIPGEWEVKIPMEHREILKQVLSQDPRPSYQQDQRRIYGMKYAGMEVRFQVEGNVLRVCEVEYELC